LKVAAEGNHTKIVMLFAKAHRDLGTNLETIFLHNSKLPRLFVIGVLGKEICQEQTLHVSSFVAHQLTRCFKTEKTENIMQAISTQSIKLKTITCSAALLARDSDSAFLCSLLPSLAPKQLEINSETVAPGLLAVLVASYRFHFKSSSRMSIASCDMHFDPHQSSLAPPIPRHEKFGPSHCYCVIMSPTTYFF